MPVSCIIGCFQPKTHRKQCAAPAYFLEITFVPRERRLWPNKSALCSAESLLLFESSPFYSKLNIFYSNRKPVFFESNIFRSNTSQLYFEQNLLHLNKR
jgi:hypothetical protein